LIQTTQSNKEKAMATKKTKTKTTKAPAEKKDEKAKGSLATARAEAIKHEDAGRWTKAAECWVRVGRLAKSRADKTDAAGRAAAAKVRASAKPAPLSEQLADNPTAKSNIESWDQALPEPGYEAPAGEGDDEADDDAGAEAPQPRERDPRLPTVGTVLIKRDRQGNERARCTIVDGGVEYNGTVYKSLSGAGLQASKDLGNKMTTCDGLAFWGLKKVARATTKNAVEALEQTWAPYRDRASAGSKLEDAEERAKVQAAIHEHVTALLAFAGDAAR